MLALIHTLLPGHSHRARSEQPDGDTQSQHVSNFGHRGRRVLWIRFFGLLFCKVSDSLQLSSSLWSSQSRCPSQRLVARTQRPDRHLKWLGEHSVSTATQHHHHHHQEDRTEIKMTLQERRTIKTSGPYHQLRPQAADRWCFLRPLETDYSQSPQATASPRCPTPTHTSPSHYDTATCRAET